jgi:hypothetical protein
VAHPLVTADPEAAWPPDCGQRPEDDQLLDPQRSVNTRTGTCIGTYTSNWTMGNAAMWRR